MIKFFRKIRLKLLFKNKFSIYLIYAIGEVILVMVGILLAFQVSQWHENNKAQILHKDLLKEVMFSLTKDLGDVNYNIESQNEIINNQQLIINWIQSNESYHDTLSPSLSGSYINTYFAAYQGPYETLKQIGMRNIKNDSLRNQISKLYNITYPRYIQFEDSYDIVVEGLFTKSFEHFNEVTWTGQMTVIDIDKFKSDNEYLSILKTTRNLGQVLIGLGMIPTKKEIEITLNMIEKELEK